MTTILFDPIRYHEARYQQLRDEAQHSRLVKEALQARQPKARGASNFLAVLGRKLADLGAALEKRYDTPPTAVVQLKTQSNSDC